MTIVQLNGTGKTYGGRWIFRDLDWSIESGSRVGLVGPNGAGKSTLFKIIAGLEHADSGQIARTRGLATSYLPQHIGPEPRTAIEVVVEARSDIAMVERELAGIATSLGDPAVAADLTRIDRLLKQQERALEKLDQLGVAGLGGEARAKLTEVGVPAAEQSKSLAQLSGGQRKLVYLVACLITRPNLLLLDEPETHLDLRARARLEAVIRAFDGSVVIISHDRYLLDETVNQIAQLDGGRITVWQGNYSVYAVERELALKRQEAVYGAQQKEIARLEDAIRRFKQWASMMPDSADNSRHVKQARNKQRQIDGMEKVERPVLERRKMKLSLRQSQRSGQKVVELTEVSVVQSGTTLLDRATLSVTRGDRIGVIGMNGAGKTILARTLVGVLPPAGGTVWTGPSVQIGYFAQNSDLASGDGTPVELLRASKPMREDEAVSHLMKFLFTYEQTRQPVKNLSGGEQSRLQLLLLMLGHSNLLVLDEPTNHLDIESMEVLEQALEEFDGTVVVASHDRYFLDRIVDRTVEVVNRCLRAHDGGYSSWSQRSSYSRDGLYPQGE